MGGVKKYLLDTNICVYLLRGKFSLNEKVKAAGGLRNCCISEVTMAELKYGDEYARQRGKGYVPQGLTLFLGMVEVIPISDAIDLYATEKARLRISGTPADDDFDLLIGCTAVKHNCVCVTENTKDFQRISGIQLDNWVNRDNSL